MMERWLGIDIGAETIKVVELRREGAHLAWARRLVAEHHKEPGPVLLGLLGGLDWPSLRGAAVTGRFGRTVALPRIPLKEAQAAGHRYLHGSAPATVVSIGAHGFSVLELRSPGVQVFRENSRCSQGTGNFLRQLVERFGLTIEEASPLCADVPDPAPLSGRCPVILKTDMTHLANKGERRERILAGLFDAVFGNVQVLVKPRVSPSPIVLIGGVSRSERIRARFPVSAERHELRFAPVTENNLFRPLSPYAVSKAAADLAAYQWSRAHGFDVVRLRPFNHTGPGQTPEFVCTDFARQVVAVERGMQPPRIAVGNLDVARDFSDVRDVVSAYVLAWQRGQSGEAYNVCSGIVRTPGEILDTLLRLSGVRAELDVQPARLRPVDVPMLVGSAAKLHAATGWAPALSWEQTLRDLLDDWRARVV